MPYQIPPAGVTAAGLYAPGAPFVDTSQPPAFLADRIDIGTGELTSLFTGADPLDAAVAYQLRVRRGSGAAVADDGQDFAAVRQNDVGAAKALEYEVRRIMAPFVTRGDAELVTVQVEAGEADGDLGAVAFQYRNLRTGKLAPEQRVEGS